MITVRVIETTLRVVDYYDDELRNLLQVNGSEAEVAEFVAQHHPDEILADLRHASIRSDTTHWDIEVDGILVGGE